MEMLDYEAVQLIKTIKENDREKFIIFLSQLRQLNKKGIS